MLKLNSGGLNGSESPSLRQLPSFNGINRYVGTAADLKGPNLPQSLNETPKLPLWEEEQERINEEVSRKRIPMLLFV